MRIKSQNGKSIASQLKEILENKMPRVANTGINSDLGTVKADPKGKAVIFTWKKNEYRMTENLKVHEKDFTGTYIVTDECKNVEKMIAEPAAVTVVASVEQEKVPVQTETAVEEIAPTPA